MAAESSPIQRPATDSTRRAALIVAAGRGNRMGGDKIWMPLGEMPVIEHSLRVFCSCQSVSRIVLVVSQERVDDAEALVGTVGAAVTICAGGERRQDSMLNGLSLVGDSPIVAVHDGARPFVTRQIIEACYEAAEQHGAALVAIPVSDTVKRADHGRWVTGTVDREGLWAAQTPQAFRTEVLKRAFESLETEVSDEAAAVEMLGHPVHIVQGDAGNFKLTTPEDLALARALWAWRSKQCCRE